MLLAVFVRPRHLAMSVPGRGSRLQQALLSRALLLWASKHRCYVWRGESRHLCLLGKQIQSGGGHWLRVFSMSGERERKKRPGTKSNDGGMI